MQKQFTPITPDQIAQFRMTLAEHQVVVPSGNEGQVVDATHGITFDFSYDGATVLTLTIMKKPWWMPPETIWDALGGYLNATYKP